MRNRLSISFVLALVLLLVLSVTAMAQGRSYSDPGQNDPRLCRNYVDEDGDGVCDHAPRAGTGEHYGYARGRGAGLGAGHYGDQDGSCDNYVDEDGDGVNDNASRDGTGEQHGRHEKRGGPNR